jgi:hypothetical protein
MPLAIAAFRVGHSADGSVADTMSALAPLVIAAWRAGICEAGVAAVPLVSVAVSPSVARAAMAPPDFTLSAVVKYGLPRFFGTMKTFSPVFSPPEADAPEPDDAEAGAEEPPDPLPEELHAASVAEATRSTAGAHRTLFVERLMLESFQPEMYYWGPCCGGPRY